MEWALPQRKVDRLLRLSENRETSPEQKVGLFTETRKKKENMDKDMLISKSDGELEISTPNSFSFLLEVKLNYQKIMWQDKAPKMKPSVRGNGSWN